MTIKYWRHFLLSRPNVGIICMVLFLWVSLLGAEQVPTDFSDALRRCQSPAIAWDRILKFRSRRHLFPIFLLFFCWDRLLEWPDMSLVEFCDILVDSFFIVMLDKYAGIGIVVVYLSDSIDFGHRFFKLSLVY